MAEEKTAKYGVNHLADKLGVAPATARVALRNAGVEKNGKSYGWDTDKALAAVVNQLKGAKTESTAKPAAKTPAAKAPATKKAAPKVSVKKKAA